MSYDFSLRKQNKEKGYNLEYVFNSANMYHFERCLSIHAKTMAKGFRLHEVMLIICII